MNLYVQNKLSNVNKRLKSVLSIIPFHTVFTPWKLKSRLFIADPLLPKKDSASILKKVQDDRDVNNNVNNGLIICKK